MKLNRRDFLKTAGKGTLAAITAGNVVNSSKAEDANKQTKGQSQMEMKSNGKPRTVTIGTITIAHPSVEPGEVRPKGPEPILKEAEISIVEAARQKCDFVCLPEVFSQMNREALAGIETVETLDGPSATFLSDMAKRHSMAMVTSLYIKDDDGKIYNMGLFYDKTGKLVGKYRKVHLADAAFVTAGDKLSVFEVDGVKVGMQICSDINFPEGCRCLALAGAEIIFWPNLCGAMPEMWTEVTMRSRAMDNCVYFVPSGTFLGGAGGFRIPKIYGRSCVIGRDGVILAEVGRKTGVAVATVSLDESGFSAHAAKRMPHTYGILMKK